MPDSGLVALDLNLHHKQGQAFQSEATELLYGGAAGGGKSHLMRTASIVWAAEIPGLQIYLFRRIRDDLVKNHMEGPKGYRAMLAPWQAAGLVNIVEDDICRAPAGALQISDKWLQGLLSAHSGQLQPRQRGASLREGDLH